MEKQSVGLALPRGRKTPARVGKSGHGGEKEQFSHREPSMSMRLALIGRGLCAGRDAWPEVTMGASFFFFFNKVLLKYKEDRESF